MALSPLSSSPSVGASRATGGAHESFKLTLARHTSVDRRAAEVAQPHQPTQAAPPVAARLVEGLDAAQRRLDAVLELARTGATFTPAQLLSLQADVYSSSQQIDLAGKLVEKATGGVKQVLQTQL